MRIIAGTARGRRLHCPRGLRTRPTPDRVREALFSIIGERVRGAKVLDLYAGTGALGLEALSRGARHATFVEKAPMAMEALRANIRTCGFEDRCSAVKAPVLSFLRTWSPQEGMGLVFLDPPYRRPEGSLTLQALASHAKSLAGAVIVLEHAFDDPPKDTPDILKVSDARRYGDTSLTLFTMKS